MAVTREALEPLPVPGLEPVTRLSVLVGKPVEVGRTVHGIRRIIPITGGTAEGPLLAGTIHGGGNDVQVVRHDGVAEIAARYALTTTGGANVFIENLGVRHAPPEVMAALARGEVVDPSAVYFRAVPRFEVDDPELAWLERDLFVATGARLPDRVRIDVHRVT